MKYEDKQMVAEYMGWVYHETDDKKWWNIIGKDGATHLLDLNDASLCVEKMVENGDWFEFFKMVDDFLDIDCCGVTAWLFNSQDFFTAMASWLRGSEAAA